MQRRLVGLSRFELLTPRLSSVCSNQLSYRPRLRAFGQATAPRAKAEILSKLDRTCAHSHRVPDRSFQEGSKRSAVNVRLFRTGADKLLSVDRSRLIRAGRRRPSAESWFSRKEVIQPQVLLQLPCYDFTPITDHTLGACLPCGLAQRLLVQPAFVM